MKRSSTIILFIIMLGIFLSPVNGLTTQQQTKIQTLLDQAQQTSGVPGISVVILVGEQEYYYNTGTANRESKILANEHTIYELASLSKAFTALGILRLEQQGLLSMTDAIEQYIPEFKIKYKEALIEPKDLTLQHFLNHRSGLTNRKHLQYISQGDGPQMIQKTVEGLVDTELAFYPGERFEYGTMNYDVLGRVIEVVPGLSYQQYIQTEILLPLGLKDTYLDGETAFQTGRLAQGYRSQFLVTQRYETPVYAGNLPAGYIRSSTKDMARWMSLQMGLVDDISKEHQQIVLKSHQPTQNTTRDETVYAGGWLVNLDQNMIEHPGTNPTFATRIKMDLKNQIGITLLANGSHLNLEVVDDLYHIVQGNVHQKYSVSPLQRLDHVLTILTISLIVSTMFIWLKLMPGLKQRLSLKTKRTFCLYKFGIIMTSVLLILSLFVPQFFGYPWSIVFIWYPYSLLTSMVTLILFSASLTYYFYRKYVSEQGECL